MPLLAAPGVFATRSPDVGSTIDELVNSSLPVVAERGDVCTGRVRSILAMMLAILPKSVGSRVHFVECPSTARIGTRVAAPEPAGSWSLAAAAIRHLFKNRSPSGCPSSSDFESHQKLDSGDLDYVYDVARSR